MIYLMWISICVNLLSAEPEISVSGPVGSTAVLPCNLTSNKGVKTYIRWKIKSETVFEREGEGDPHQGEGYEGRVDVTVKELHKGNCSLVLRNLTRADTGVYTSYQRELVLINSVKLSVYDDAVGKSPHPLVLVLSLVSCLLVQLFCGETSV